MALKRVRLITLPPVAVFEFGVAVEVFGIDRRDNGIESFDFKVCAVEPGVPLPAKDVDPFTITPQHGLDEVPDSDLVIVSATLVREDADYPQEVLDVVRTAHANGATVLSLCSASFVLGAAGLLDGRRSTTHWIYADLMQRRFPLSRVDPTVLFVEDDRVVTSAGTAAGIDACLHLVRKELGTSVATTIARRMVVPPQRDGGQQQYVDNPIPECATDSFAPLLDWLVEHLAEDHTIASLATRAMMSERTFARRFSAATGTTPYKWLNTQRVLAARSLLEESDLPVEQIAARVGFNSPVVLRDHFRRTVGVAPSDYRRRFGLPESA
ncbi:MAG: helix-turn-helix domain-containing protein [Propionicimonas sp.]|nr:helix-turn-helix domain-containing protein [Propionicimonas sp.]